MDPQQKIFDSLKASSQQPGHNRRAGFGFGGGSTQVAVTSSSVSDTVDNAGEHIQNKAAAAAAAVRAATTATAKATATSTTKTTTTTTTKSRQTMSAVSSSTSLAGQKRKHESKVHHARPTPTVPYPSASSTSSARPVQQQQPIQHQQPYSEKRRGVESHYDQRAAVKTTDAASMDAITSKRQNDRTFKLKKFHNDIKWRLINRYSAGAAWHLDLACGRGGDIRKWNDAGIEHVHGVDISGHEIEEARRRLRVVEDQKGYSLPYEFERRDDVGSHPIAWPRRYQSVSCMFAAHYFFVSEAAVKAFVTNAASALSPGGYFYGTIACGKRVLAKLNQRNRYRSQLLDLQKRWKGEFGHFQYFGSGYTFAIAQTVTSNVDAEEVGEGCEEYLVFFRVLTDICARHGLRPISDHDWNLPGRRYNDHPVIETRAAEGKYGAFRHFDPVRQCGCFVCSGSLYVLLCVLLCVCVCGCACGWVGA